MAGPKGNTTAQAPYQDTYSGTKPTVIAPAAAAKVINGSHPKPGPRAQSYPDSFSE